MTTRLDALSVREVNGKSYFTRVGVAFPSKDGSGWNLLLDAMPAPTDGQFKIMLRPPRDDNAPAGRAKPASNAPAFDDVTGDDDIPF